jgi:hypothetical protein
MNFTQTQTIDNTLFQVPACDKLQQLAFLGFNYNTLCDFNLILKDAESCAMSQECMNAQVQASREDYNVCYQQLESPLRQGKMNNQIAFGFNQADFAKYACFNGQITPNEQTTISHDANSAPKKKWLPAGKKADKSDPELRNLSNTYFWERRNILLQMLDSYHDDEAVLIKATAKANKNSNNTPRRPRGSIYRGVSKNKAKWQVMIMGNFKKMYFGAIEDEREAALFYDKLAIVSHGIKARTNFPYTRRDIIAILNEEGLSNAWSK